MEQIVASVNRLAGAMREMADASDSQATQVREISLALGHVDGLTQQNAALEEETTAAAQSLHEQSQHLQQQVGRFRTAPGRRGRRPGAGLGAEAPITCGDG